MTKKQIRQKSALERLETQLKSGVKVLKGKGGGKIELTEKDKQRITQEIRVLKQKLQYK